MKKKQNKPYEIYVAIKAIKGFNTGFISAYVVMYDGKKVIADTQVLRGYTGPHSVLIGIYNAISWIPPGESVILYTTDRYAEFAFNIQWKVPQNIKNRETISEIFDVLQTMRDHRVSHNPSSAMLKYAKRAIREVA